MQKVRILLCFICLLLPLPLLAVTIEEEIEKERQRMYSYYQTDSVEQFMSAVDRLMDLSEKAGDDRNFYRAWSNKALYAFRKMGREKGLELAKEELAHAEKHDSKFGMYSATSANASMMSSLGQIVLAEQGYLKCIEYMHRYFPDESAAADYVGLAKIAENNHDYAKVVEYAEKALAEPNLNPIHKQVALGYFCVAIAKQIKGPDDVKRFNEAYKQWAEQREKTQQNGGLTGIVRFYYAKVNGHYEEALKEAQQINSVLNRLPFVSEAYALLGNYQEAYQTYREYKKVTDSLNTASIRQHTSEYAMQLGVARAEMEAQQSRERTHHVMMAMVGVVALITIFFLSFYLYRRRQQLKQLRKAYDQLKETTTEKERYASELRIARDIQMNMVPNTFPAFPERQDIDLYAAMIPAREVGGDLYDYILAGDRLCFCVGDVSGKGVPAAMTMTVVVNLFRTFAKDGFSPTDIATRLNDTLAEDNESGTFVTMFIGVIDLASGSLDYCNCGHNPPVMIDMQRPSLMETETNVVIGLWPGFQFVGGHVSSILFKPLIIYTDGLTEAENVRQEQFGEAHMLEVLEWNRFENAEQTVKLLLKEVKLHEEGTAPSDDLSVFCLYIK